MKNRKVFIDYLQLADNACENLKDNNPTKKNVLIVFDDMIEDMEGNKKLSSIVTELFIRGRKLDILLLFISQSYFKVPKIITLNLTHCFMMDTKKIESII